MSYLVVAVLLSSDEPQGLLGPTSAPASVDLHSQILLESERAVGLEELDADGPLPITVEIGGHAIRLDAVRSLDVDAHIVTE